jgi:PBP1b-binding outer membrane lipoprotein LpoB
MNLLKSFFLILIIALLLNGCGGDDKKKDTETKDKKVSEAIEKTEVKDKVIDSKRQDKLDNLPPELKGNAKKVKKVKTRLDAHKSRINETIRKSDKLISDLDKKIESTKKK